MALLLWLCLLCCLTTVRRAQASAAARQTSTTTRPNILFIISDDQSWLHAGAYGEAATKTPTFDRLAREGVLFTNAYCSSPSCAPSRAAILTGQHFWRLKQGANMRAHLPREFAVYPDLLEAAGYRVGFDGKGYGPARLNNRETPGDDAEADSGYRLPSHEERGRNPAGEKYKNFADFLKQLPAGRPFAYWFGSQNPHDPYDAGSGLRGGKRLSDVKLPPWLPDAPEIRSHFLDYYLEIEAFDRELADLLHGLARAGLSDDTIVVVTSDNGMAIPRGKTSLYDWGTRLPLVVRWPRRVPGSRVVTDFVSLTDLAPTFLEAAGLKVPPAMTGRSLLNVLNATKAGRVDARRDHVLTGRERHGPQRPQALGYPSRAVRTDDYLYIRNFAPERLPCGEPPHTADCGMMEYLRAYKDEPAIRPLYELTAGRRPAEELYDLRRDPAQVRDVAGEPGYAGVRQRLADQLMRELRRAGDPRALGGGDVFDRYPFWGPGWTGR